MATNTIAASTADGHTTLSIAARALLFFVRAYQICFSALLPSACKFYPTCSHYAADALRLHGARQGCWLALRRLLRCHPFTRGGVDLVPDSIPNKDGEPRASRLLPTGPEVHS